MTEPPTCPVCGEPIVPHPTPYPELAAVRCGCQFVRDPDDCDTEPLWVVTYVRAGVDPVARHHETVATVSVAQTL